MRHKTKKVMVGKVPIGGGSPISIQSMTNTDTRDIQKTVSQIRELEEAGCQIVRCAIPDMEAALALKEIKKSVSLPIVADIHFDYRLALLAMENGADKIRINPGNIGGSDRVKAVLKAAKDRGIPLRIGVNSGSLEKHILEKYGGPTGIALADSALTMIRQIEEMDFTDIVVSIKSSNVKVNYDAHKIIIEKVPYPLHIGITEAGTINTGKVKSAVGIGALLLSGIGDTIRVSLTGNPVEEVLYAKQILKATGLRNSGINLISCPTCGRTSVDLLTITQGIEERLGKVENKWEFNGMPSITIAIMGCEVNGPGEAREADLGVAFGKNKALIFKKGKIVQHCKPDEAIDVIINMMDEL